MKKFTLLLGLMFAIASMFGQEEPLMTQGFETSNLNNTGWVAVAAPSGHTWTIVTVPFSGPSTIADAHSGTRSVYAPNSGSNVPDTWLYSSALSLTQVGEYTIRFWLKHPKHYSRSDVNELKLWVGTSQTVGDMTEELWAQGTTPIANWQEFEVKFTPATTGTYHFGFHTSGAVNGGAIFIDDFSVYPPEAPKPANDLTLDCPAPLPFTKLPLFFSLPDAINGDITNSGTANQTNVKLSVKLNENAPKESTPTDINAGESANMNVDITALTPVSGENTMMVYASSDATNEMLEDDTVKVNFQGTDHILSVSGNPTATVTGSANTFTKGALYSLTKPAMLSKIIVKFKGATTGASSESHNIYLWLFRMASATKIDGTFATNTPTGALVNQKIIRPADADSYTDGYAYEITPTYLTEGDYMLCIRHGTNFPAEGKSGVGVDGDASRKHYEITGSTGNITEYSGGLGLDMYLEEPIANDIELVADAFPYTNIPKTQSLPQLSAQAKNVGIEAQTNVKFLAQLDAEEPMESDPVASLDAMTTSSAMTITPAQTLLVEGDHTLTYSVAQTEEDEVPENNEKTFYFEVSEDTYAADTVTEITVGTTHNAATTLGNVFSITQTTSISAVEVGFLSTSELDYKVALYRMTDATTMEADPLFLQDAERPATNGFQTVTLTEPVALSPGNYFLAAEQLTTEALGVAYDQSERMYYTKNANNLVTQTGSGALAIRMILEEEVEETNEVSLTSLTPSIFLPYTQIPSSQKLALPQISASITNIGTMDLTKVNITLELDGNIFAKSDSLDMTSGESKDFSLTPAPQTLSKGEHTLVFKMFSNETPEGYPGKATDTFTFVSDVTFALDTVEGIYDSLSSDYYTNINGGGLSGMGFAGNLFTLNEQATVKSLVVGFNGRGRITGNVLMTRIYKVNPADTTITEIITSSGRIFSKMDTTASELTLEFPEYTVLEAGMYYAAISSSGAALNLRGDNSQGKAYYTLPTSNPEMDSKLTAVASAAGVPVMRMVFTEETCSVLTDVKVDIVHPEPIFSWNGDAEKYKIVVRNANNKNKVDSLVTTETSVTLPNVREDMDYEFAVTAYCSSVHVSEWIPFMVKHDVEVVLNDWLDGTQYHNLSNAETIAMTVRNLGTSNQANLELSYNLNGNVNSITMSAEDTIKPGEEKVYELLANADLSASKAHTIKVFAGNAAYPDKNLLNDTATVIITNGNLKDLSFEGIAAPADEYALFADGSVKVKVRNNWPIEAKNIPVELKMDGNTVSTDTILSIPAGNTYEYTFKNPLNITETGNYDLEVYIHNGDDTVRKTIHCFENFDAEILEILSPVNGANLPSDAAVTAKVQNNGSKKIENLPIYFIFNGGQAVAGTVPEIAAGKSVDFTFDQKVNLTTSNEHSLMVYCVLDGDLNSANDVLSKRITNTVIDAAVTAISSPVSAVDLTGEETVIATVKNLGNVEISDIPLTLSLDGDTIVIDTIKELIAAGDSVNYTFTKTLDLSADGEYTIKVVLCLTDDVKAENDTLEKVVLNDVAAPDVAVTAISSPVSGTNLTNEETVTVTVKNLGNVDLSDIPVALRLNGDAITIDTITETIAAGDSMEYTFTETLDLSAAGEHTIRVSGILANDVNISNDAQEIVIFNTVPDVAVTAISSPVSGENLTNAETVTITVKNFGNAEISNVPVILKLDGNSITTETISETIAAGNSVNYTFTQKLDLTADETTEFEISAQTTHEDDLNAGNDEFSVEVTNTKPSSIAERLNATAIRLYPNPTSDKLFVKTTEKVKRTEIYSVEGKLMKTIEGNLQEISVGELKSGIYLLRITTENGVAQQRFVKE